jgi:hypothetical protein
MSRDTGAMGYCEVHEKLMYPDRKSARKVARQHASHKNAYRCSVNTMFWHIGELPRMVIEGHVDRETYYGEAA